MVDAILQRPLRVWESLGTTPESHAFADVVSSFLTSIARLAWQTNFQRDLVANFEVFNI